MREEVKQLIMTLSRDNVVKINKILKIKPNGARTKAEFVQRLLSYPGDDLTVDFIKRNISSKVNKQTLINNATARGI